MLALSDNCSPSDSSCSEDDLGGANSSGYVRRKTRSQRSTMVDHLTGRSGGAGDGMGLNQSCSSSGRQRGGGGVTSHIIDVEGRGGNGLESDDDDEDIPAEAVSI